MGKKHKKHKPEWITVAGTRLFYLSLASGCYAFVAASFLLALFCYYQKLGMLQLFTMIFFMQTPSARKNLQSVMLVIMSET